MNETSGDEKRNGTTSSQFCTSGSVVTHAGSANCPSYKN